MEILNPKVGTVPKKFIKKVFVKNKKVFVAHKSPHTLFSKMENHVCFSRRFKTIIKII